MQRGKDALQKKDYSHAALQFKIASKLLPKDAEPLYQLALTYLEVGDVETAAQALTRANTVDPKHAASQVKLAQLMALQANPEVVREAERRAQAVMAASQGNVDAISTLALAEMRLGETVSAEGHLKEALAQFPKELVPAVLMASLKIQGKDFNGAEAILKKLVEQAPKSVNAHLALEKFYRDMGRSTDAEVWAVRGLEIDPKNAPLLIDLASIQMSMGQKAQAEQTYRRLSLLPDKASRSLLAVFLFGDGRREEAITELKRLVKADPEDRAVRTQLISAFLATHRVPEATAVLTEALMRNPQDVDALLQRSQIFLLENKTSAAETDLNNVLRFRPDSAQAHYILARVRQLQGAILNQRRELTRGLELDPTLLVARIDLAESLIKAGDPKAALDLMNAAPDRQRDQIPVIVQRNWALWGVGDLPEMRKGVERGLGLARTSDLLLQHALLQIRAHDLNGGRSTIEAALKLNPEDVRALEVLVGTYVAVKQPQVALEKVKQYAAERPNSAVLQQFLGMAMASNGRLSEARSAFEAAKSADSSNLGAEFSLAQLDLTEGKLDSARNRLSGVLSANPGSLDARLLLGMVEEVVGNYETAISNYRKVLESESRNLFALNNLAYRLANRPNQQFDEALKYAQEALELSPNNPAIQDTIGWVYYRKGLYKNAIPHLTSAAAGGKVPVRMYHLTLAYLKLGDEKRARQTFDQAFRLDPTLPEAKTIQEAFSHSPGTNRESH